MAETAKVFESGNSQAIRLPKAFRLDAKEVWISRDSTTGAIILKPKKGTSSLDKLFKLIDENTFPGDFLAESTRRNTQPALPAEFKPKRASRVGRKTA